MAGDLDVVVIGAGAAGLAAGRAAEAAGLAFRVIEAKSRTGGAPTFASARYRDTGETWAVLEGFGALIVRQGAAVPVTLDCAATAIDWSGPLLRIATVRGTLTARTVILTPSTDLLGQLRFTPDLPGWKRDAIAALPMGAANKIAFAFAGAPFGEGGPYFTMLDRADGSGAVVLVDPAIQPFATLFVGGVEADEMERAGAAA